MEQQNRTLCGFEVRSRRGKEPRVKMRNRKKGYHTKRGRKKETPIPEDVARDSALGEEPMTEEGEDEGTEKKTRDRIPEGANRAPLRIEEPKEP